MTSDRTAVITKDERPRLALVPARLDLSSVQLQMILGMVATLLLCLVVYWPSLQAGFLLDDFLHLNYVAKTSHGQWHDFLQNFTGNWAGSDIMRSYRPVSSASLLFDYWLWGLNSAGYHLTNILLLAGAAITVGLITLELTGFYGNRLGAAPAIWSMILFALFPLHPEAAAWIIGRVDLLCTVFYLSSVFFYLRFRLLRERPYLWASLIAFGLAITSKEMAVTLPLVITCAELLLWNPKAQDSIAASRTDRLNRFIYIAIFWAMFAIVASLRAMAIGVVVGGYAGEGASVLLSTLNNLYDRATMLKIFFPINEEIYYRNLPAFLWIKPVLVSGYSACAAVLGVRLLLRKTQLAPIAFLVAWLIISIAPAAQVWHIYPNLVGSRLFYLGSAPLAMLLSMAALPAVDSLRRKYSQVATTIGVIALAVISLSWGWCLIANLEPWTQAGLQMSALRRQIKESTKEIADGKKILLLDLPTDYRGAGMLTRTHYLNLACQPPFAASDLSPKLSTIEPAILGAPDFMWPGAFQQMLVAPDLVRTLRWDKDHGQFAPWQRQPLSNGGHPSYEYTYKENEAGKLQIDPPSVPSASADKWKVLSENASCITAFPKMLRIFPGNAAITVYLPAVDLDPLAAGIAELDLDYTARTGCPACYSGRLKLVWEGTGVDGSQIKGEAAVPDRRMHKTLIWLGRYRSWTLARRITKLGLCCQPGEYFVDLLGARITPATGTVPTARLLPADGSNLVLSVLDTVHRIDPETILKAPPQISYDASKIAGAATVKIMTTATNVTFDPAGPADLYTVYPSAGKPSLDEFDSSTLTGTYRLPAALATAPGVHQIRVVAFSADGQIMGLPGEPISILVAPAKP